MTSSYSDSATATFIPKYAQPFGMAELEELDTALISQEIQRLQKSIALLESTNAHLLSSLNPSSSSPSTATATDSEQLDDDDAQIYRETIDENGEAIAKQAERIQMCVWVIKKRMGMDPGNRHYELDQDTTAITAVKRDEGVERVTVSQQQNTNNSTSQQADSTPQQPTRLEPAVDEGEGMYL